MAYAVIRDTDIYYTIPIVEAFIRGYCFYRLVKPFMISSIAPNGIEGPVWKKKQGGRGVGAAYFVAMLLLYIIPLHMDVYTAYGLGSFIMFFLICLMDRRNYKQKAFLVMTFFSISWLSAAIAEILYDHLYAFAENTEYMISHPDMWLALYAGVCVFYLAMEFVFTAVGIRQVLKVYANKNADMEKRELIMLILPSLMVVMAYKIIQHYRMFYITENAENRDLYDILSVLFYAASVIAIIAVIVLYQNIKATQEENLQAKLLATQIDSIRQHIEQVESLYQNIRSVRHDMTNHILTLERLYEGNQTDEARSYSDDLKAELAEMTGEIKSGNPVTDVILQGLKKEAAKRGISFCSEFYYPADSNINAFDISVILNNALQNAVENTGMGGHVSIASYHRNNAYMIEISNSFTGNLQWDSGSGLLATSKEDVEGHGYGLLNIRRVARKYGGDIDIVPEEGVFCLCVMLMTE